MTQEEKAKAYDKAVKKAEILYKVSEPMSSCNVIIETIFPELAESKDEQIRKGLIALLKFGLEDCNAIAPGYNITKEEAITWLENQNEHKNSVVDFKAKDWYVSKVDDKIHNIYHSVDKVKSKFHEGDWIVGANNVCKIISLNNELNCYIAVTTNNEEVKIPYYFDDEQGHMCSYHLWSIEDAKEGDVLANDYHILILKELAYDWSSNGTPNSVKAYCDIKPNGSFEIGKDNWCFCGTLHIHPATKEQRDLLFQKMKEEGYEWDAEKKEIN